MNSTRWTSPSGYCSVEITEDAMKKILRIADKAHPHEGGTALYGHYSNDGKVAFIEGVAPESKDSAGSRFRFKRGASGLAAFFHRLFERSRGEQFYVGEFHSHPGGAPSPSHTDDETQFSIACDTESRCEAPVLVLVGGSPTERDIAVFVHTRARAQYSLRCSEGDGGPLRNDL